MIKHIVVWRLRDRGDTAAAAKAAKRIKELLEGLRGKVPGLVSIEVGVNIVEDAGASDVALLCVFKDRAALELYQTHPAHEAVKPAVRDLVNERRSVDYEV